MTAARPFLSPAPASAALGSRVMTNTLLGGVLRSRMSAISWTCRFARRRQPNSARLSMRSVHPAGQDRLADLPTSDMLSILLAASGVHPGQLQFKGDRLEVSGAAH